MTGHKRLDFTSALFLDLRHRSSELPGWESLTTGVPATVKEIAVARRIARAVASSQGADAGLVARSTLHALIDVFTQLPGAGDIVAVDEAAYPTTRHAAALARRPGVALLTYRHHRPESIPQTGRRLLVATDGWCSGCNRPAPLGRLRDIATQHGGLVIVDDSLSYGVLGRRHGDDAFGDGTGTIRWLSHGHNGILWLASLAKAYGTPIAVLTGPRVVVEALRSTGNRLHASAPSAPDLHAAWRALALREEVRQRRRRLQALVMLLRTGLINAGLAVRGLPFPVVPIPMPTPMALRWWRLLRSNGIDALVQLPRCLPGAQVSFVLSPQHSPAELGRVVRSLRGIKESSSAA